MQVVEQNPDHPGLVAGWQRFEPARPMQAADLHMHIPGPHAFVKTKVSAVLVICMYIPRAPYARCIGSRVYQSEHYT